MSRSKKLKQAVKKYISPKELSVRWCCARSSVDRITKRAGLTRLFLGEGKNGIVRYLIEEIENFENSRKISGGV